MTESGSKKSSVLIIVRIVLVITIVCCGAAGMYMLAKMKKPPVKRKPAELMFSSAGIRVFPETVQTVLSGWGTARPRSHVEISTEVAGRITYLNPMIEIGEIIEKDALLCEIDPRSYSLKVKTAEADVLRLETSLEQTKLEEENAKLRLEIAKRSAELAQREFERYKKLTMNDGVETTSKMESAELAVTREETTVTTLENTLRLVPSRMRQIQAQLDRARSALEDAKLNLSKTKIKAPFAGRVTQKYVEAEQVATVNQRLLSLADDSLLEIPVSLNSREFARWLGITPSEKNNYWFGEITDQPVTIRWTESAEDYSWPGRLARVEKYDPDTRTLNVLIEVSPSDEGASAASSDFPLVEGMFCIVEIPGRIAHDVFRVPRDVVSQDNTILISNAGRLATRTVKVARRERDWVLIEEGLKEGDVILTSRPPKIIDGMKLELTVLNEHDQSGMQAMESPTSSGLKNVSKDPQSGGVVQ